MISLPWYLLAAGIVLIVLGYILAAGTGPNFQKRVNNRMSDQEIGQQLKREQRLSIPSMIILLGFGCVLASGIWRLVRWLA